MEFTGSSGTKYNVVAGIKFNTTRAGIDLKNALKDFEKVSTVQVKAVFNGQDAIRQVNTYRDSVGKLFEEIQHFKKVTTDGGKSFGLVALDGGEVGKVKQLSENFKILTTSTETNVSATGRLITRTKEYSDGVLQCVNVTQQYRNAQNQLVTETQKLDAQGHKLGDTQRKITNDIKTTTTEINKYIDAQGREVTEITKLNAQRDGEIERITKRQTVEGGLITTTERLRVSQGRETDEVIESNTVIERNTMITKENTQSKQANIKTTKETSSVTSNFIATLGKVLKFQIVTKIITGFTTACREAVNIVKEFDLQLTEMKKVSEYSGNALDEYTKKLGDLGTAVARTRTQMVEGATQFIKAGYDEQISAQLAQVSALFSNIADSELDAGQSATFIISQMKAFREELEKLGDEGRQATYVIDAINEVSNNTAVSSTDISIALSKTASAMSALGNNYHQTIALVTAGTEIMQGQASKVARGLRSFGNQIAKTATSAGELSFEVQGATKSIALMGKDGNLKSTYEVLQEISKEWNNMTSAERQALGISLAGKTQFEVFTSVLNNFADAERALTLAEESQGSAWKENARYMESIEAKYQALKTAIENLVLGDGGLEKLVKHILDLSTKIVKLVDNAGGLKTVVLSLTTALILLNSNGIQQIINNIIKLIPLIETAKVEYTAFGVGVTTANEAMTISIPVIGIVITVLTGLITVLTVVANSIENNIDKIQELNTNIESEDNEIQIIIKDIEKLKGRLEELNKVENPTFVDQQEINNLNYTIQQLERELALKQKLLEADKKEREEKALKVVTSRHSTAGVDYKLNQEGIYWSNIMGDRSDDTQYDLEGKQSYQKVKIYTERVKALKEEAVALQEVNKNLDKNTTEYKKNQEKIEQADALIKSYDLMLQDMVVELQSATEGLDEHSVAFLLAKDAIDTYSDSILQYQTAEEQAKTEQDVVNVALQNARDQYQLTEEQYKELQDVVQEAIDNKDDEEEAYTVATKAIDEYISSLEEASKEVSDWSEKLDEIQSAYGVLSSAVNEYNESQALSIDTIQSLMALGSDYLSMLDFENGKLVLNEQAIYNKVKAQIEQAKATVYQEAVERLEILTAEKHQKATENSTSATKNDTTALDENTDALLRNAKANFADAMGKARREKVSEKEIKAIVDDMNNQLKLLDDVLLNVGKNFTTAMSSGSKATDKANKSTSSANKTLKETNTELEKLKQNISDLKDEISEYEKIFSYLGGKLDEEIDKLEEAKDNETDAIDKQIDALEELKDTLEENSKERVDQLEKEKNALIDANKLEINTLQEKQNAEEEYWNNKIQALKDANSELESQIELEQLLANLEKAKNTKVRVYKKGQGFVWDTDQNAVSEAQKKIDEYNRKKNYEEQLAELENFKKKSQDNYEQQINNLKTLNDNIKNEYDKQIEALKEDTDNKVKDYERQIKELNNLKTEIENHYKFEIDNLNNYKNNLEKQSKSYETEQNRLLTLERTGIDTEKANWTERLNNLGSFVTEYNNKLAELDAKQKQLKEMEGKVSSTTSSSGDTSSGSTTIATTDNNGGSRRRQVWYAGDKTFYSQKDVDDYINDRKSQISSIQEQNAFIKMAIAREPNPNVKDQLKQKLTTPPSLPTVTTGWESYGSGASAIGSNQFAIVGDDPNKEIIIGSKLNGLGLKLAKGTGVVNAKSTGTLAGLFNILGSELSKGINGSYNLSNSNTQTSQNIHIDNITLPEVRDAEDFINALSNFENIMAQKAYAV